MALPADIKLSTLSVGPAADIGGVQAVLNVTVTPVFGGNRVNLVYAPTGSIIISTPLKPPQSEAGGIVTFQVPTTDQPGFVTENQEPITGWAYEVKATASNANWTVNIPPKLISPLTGQDYVDVDMVPVQASADLVTAGTPMVLSFNGQTGHVYSTAGSGHHRHHSGADGGLGNLHGGRVRPPGRHDHTRGPVQHQGPRAHHVPVHARRARTRRRHHPLMGMHATGTGRGN